MPQILALLTISGGFSVWYYVRRGNCLQLGIYFNLCAMAYMAFGLTVSRATMGRAYTDQLDQIGWMSVAAVIGFNLAYALAGVRQRSNAIRVREYLPSHTTLLFVVGVALAFEAAAILLIGPLDFLFSDRIERFAVVRPRVALFYLANFINVCLPIVLARYLYFGNRRDRALLYFILCHGILVGLLTISRYDLSIIVICLCYFLERSGRIRPRTVALVMVLSLSVTLLFKPALYDLLLNQDYPSNIDLGEYTNWIRHTVLLMTRPDVELPHNGYALALKSLFVMRPEEDALSEWFFQEFFPERVILFPGLGYGFSGLWEGYSANGLMGIAVQFAFFGACFGLLERSPSAMRHVFIVFVLILTYRLFRSEVYNFVKTYAWYFAYPTFAIVFVDKFMIWATRRRGMATGGWTRDGAPEHAGRGYAAQE